MYSKRPSRHKRHFLLLAAGSGLRFGGDKPKQLCRIGGKSILEHSLNTICAYDGVDSIRLVLQKPLWEYATALTTGLADERVHLVLGGKNRLESVFLGLQAIHADDQSDESLVLVHDAARPFYTHRILDDCWHVLQEYEAACVAVPCTDSLVRLNQDKGQIIGVVDRSLYYRSQTPQGARVQTLRQAYECIANPAKAPLTDASFTHAPFTDDCGVLLNAFQQIRIGIVCGDEDNIKITYSRDLWLAEQIIKNTPHRG